jgi:hypothetical protein
MMYFYWKNKGIRPSVLYSMPKGELMVIQAFYEREQEEHNELIKGVGDKGAIPTIILN